MIPRFTAWDRGNAPVSHRPIRAAEITEHHCFVFLCFAVGYFFRAVVSHLVRLVPFFFLQAFSAFLSFSAFVSVLTGPGSFLSSWASFALSAAIDW